MKSIVRDYEEGFRRGRQDGVNRTLVFCMVALSNLYGWRKEPLEKVLIEAGRIAGEASKNPEWTSILEHRLKELGVGIHIAEAGNDN